MIGIVILNYMAYEEAINCVHSILNTTNDQYKIYIIDNNSTNESVRVLKSEFGNNQQVEIIENDINSGYAAGNNVGIKRALEDSCDHILISNSDIIYKDKSINNMREFLNSNNNVGIVGPKILKPNGELEKKSRIFLRTDIMEKIFARTKLRKLNIKDIYTRYYGLNVSFNDTVSVYTLLGACFMMTRQMAELITPFDENTFLYEEEMIIGIRAEKTGLKTYYYPASEVIHKHAASSKYIGAYSLIHLVNSEIYYCKTYLKRTTLEIIPIYLIRLMLYVSRCFKDINYRKNFKNFMVETQKRLWSKNGLGKGKNPKGEEQ